VSARFARTPAYPVMTEVGSADGMQDIPSARMHSDGAVASYDQLFTMRDAEGQPKLLSSPGTFGTLIRAGKGR
jgi:hypothetical protein